jgi:hypothetical protein
MVRLPGLPACFFIESGDDTTGTFDYRSGGKVIVRRDAVPMQHHAARRGTEAVEVVISIDDNVITGPRLHFKQDETLSLPARFGAAGDHIQFSHGITLVDRDQRVEITSKSVDQHQAVCRSRPQPPDRGAPRFLRVFRFQRLPGGTVALSGNGAAGTGNDDGIGKVVIRRPGLGGNNEQGQQAGCQPQDPNGELMACLCLHILNH